MEDYKTMYKTMYLAVDDAMEKLREAAAMLRTAQKWCGKPFTDADDTPPGLHGSSSSNKNGASE